MLFQPAGHRIRAKSHRAADANGGEYGLLGKSENADRRNRQHFRHLRRGQCASDSERDQGSGDFEEDGRLWNLYYRRVSIMLNYKEIFNFIG